MSARERPRLAFRATAEFLHKSGPWNLVAVALFLLLSWIMLRCAWIGDDAYISMRVVDNFHRGYGLCWNVGERVWAYTNPLMTLSLVGLYPFTHELYLTCILMSLSVTAIAVGLVLFRLAPRSSAMILVATLLLTSKAFIDYSTSGLENCFSYLLLGVFYVIVLKVRRYGSRGVFCMALVVGLSLLNRLDLVLLELPLLVWVLWQRRSARSLFLLGLGLAPFLAWEMFAFIYYGTLVPNTYYAKLEAGIPWGAVAIQGALYYAHSLWSDPITLPAIVTVLVMALRVGRIEHRLAGVGVLLYMLYAYYINDFMSGRFFAVPMFCSVMLLCVLLTNRLVHYSRTVPVVFPLLLLVTSALHPLSPLRSGADYDLGRTDHQYRSMGITDERAYYYSGAGLLRAGRSGFEPDNIWRRIGEGYRASSDRVRIDGCIGFRGFYAGPKVHFIDPCGLGDLLLARLPARLDRPLQQGNYLRVVPAGYKESIQDGEDHFADPGISRLYKALRCIACDPIWTKRRWQAIWKLSTGQYLDLIDRPCYQVADEAHFMKLRTAPIQQFLRNCRAGVLVRIAGRTPSPSDGARSEPTPPALTASQATPELQAP